MQRPSHSLMICCLICCLWESLLSVQVWWNECTHTSVCGEGVGVVPRQLRTITGSRIPICRFRCDNSHIWKAMAFSLRERQRILKPRVLKVWVNEWVSEWVKSLSCVRLFATPWTVAEPGSSVRGIFQARILVWVAIAFSRRSSRPRDWTQVSRIVGRHFTVWATREDRKHENWPKIVSCFEMGGVNRKNENSDGEDYRKRREAVVGMGISFC